MRYKLLTYLLTYLPTTYYLLLTYYYLPGMLTRPEVSRPRPVSQGQGQGHRSKAKAENAKVNFLVNAKVNPAFQ